MTRHGKTLAIAVAVVGMSLIGSGQAMAARVVTGRGGTAIKPKQIIASHDADFIIGGTDFTDGRSLDTFGTVKWTTYTQREAWATGVAFQNDCDPDCADGTFKPTAVRIHLSQTKGNIYRRMTLVRRGRVWARLVAVHGTSPPGWEWLTPAR